MSAKPYKTLAGLEAEVRRRLSWSSFLVITADKQRKMIFVRDVHEAGIFTHHVLESLYYPRMGHEIDVDVFYNDKFESELRLTIRLEPFKVW